MASARSRAGRVLVSRSTVMAAPPIGHLWGRLPYCVPPNGAMYTERSPLALQSTTLLTVCTPIGVLLTRGNNDGHGPAGWSRPALRHALGYRPPRQPCFTATESAPTGGGAANRTRPRVETHVLPALLRMNEHVKQYLHPIPPAAAI